MSGGKSKRLVLLAPLLLAFIAGCQTTPTLSADPERALVCKDLRRSLAGDVDLGAYIPTFGFRIKWNVPNEVTEQRLVAVQDMFLHCSLWATRAITSDQFAKALDKSSTVYASDSADRIATLEGRLKSVEKGLERAPEVSSKRDASQGLVGKALDIGTETAQAERMAEVNHENTGAMRVDLTPIVERLAKQEQANGQTVEALAALTRRFEGLDKSPQLPGRLVPVAGPISVFFQTGSADLSEASKAALSRLTSRPDAAHVHAVVQGYADERGDNAQNISLSQRRASAVEAYLVEHGLAVIAANGDGETVAFSGGLESNRRVVVEAFESRSGG